MAAPTAAPTAEAGIGPHRYRIAEDVFEWVPQGEVLAEHAQRVCEILGRMLELYGYVLWRVDARGSVPLGLEARRFYALWLIERRPLLALAAFGDSSALPRTTAKLTTQAVRIKSGHEILTDNFASVEEADAYLREHRQLFRDALAATAS